RGLLSTQLSLESARAERLTAAVDLCLSLGGGWEWKTKDDLETKELPTPWENDKKDKGVKN
ncbi:MAG: RND transporter, partial [Synergistaceae bacterium]|nr:RND transporter [Synergistaceae bacterium]